MTRVYFTAENPLTRGELWYIREPRLFSVANNQTIDLLPELHVEVCTLAADLLNDIDVGETQRSDRAYEQQYLTIERTGKIQ